MEGEGQGKRKRRYIISYTVASIAAKLQLKAYLLSLSRECPPSSIFLQKKDNTDLIQKVRYFTYWY